MVLLFGSVRTSRITYTPISSVQLLQHSPLPTNSAQRRWLNLQSPEAATCTAPSDSSHLRSTITQQPSAQHHHTQLHTSSTQAAHKQHTSSTQSPHNRHTIATQAHNQHTSSTRCTSSTCLMVRLTRSKNCGTSCVLTYSLQLCGFAAGTSWISVGGDLSTKSVSTRYLHQLYSRTASAHSSHLQPHCIHSRTASTHAPHVCQLCL